MIVTIDGPAGAGKSSIARKVAEQLDFEFLDTGAMYRAVTLGAIRNQISFDDANALVAYAGCVKLKWHLCRIYLDGVDVSEEIRTPTVTSAIHFLADIAAVRSQLSRQQRRIAKGRNIVTEGRDQGSEVFPDADCKIFLTASPEQLRDPAPAATRQHRTVSDDRRCDSGTESSRRRRPESTDRSPSSRGRCGHPQHGRHDARRSASPDTRNCICGNRPLKISTKRLSQLRRNPAHGALNAVGRSQPIAEPR